MDRATESGCFSVRYRFHILDDYRIDLRQLDVYFTRPKGSATGKARKPEWRETVHRLRYDTYVQDHGYDSRGSK